jgi:hypothetical protein
MWFQNEYDKVVIIEVRVVQVWSEIKLHSNFAFVQFFNHAFDLWPNCSPLRLITIINSVYPDLPCQLPCGTKPEQLEENPQLSADCWLTLITWVSSENQSHKIRGVCSDDYATKAPCTGVARAIYPGRQYKFQIITIIHFFYEHDIICIATPYNIWTRQNIWIRQILRYMNTTKFALPPRVYCNGYASGPLAMIIWSDDHPSR